MKAKGALEIIEFYSTLTEMAQDEIQRDFDNALSIVKQALTELEEYKKSDASKEQSSIDYFNEMKKYKKELAELKKEVLELTIDIRTSKKIRNKFYDEITRLEELCKGSEER